MSGPEYSPADFLHAWAEGWETVPPEGRTAVPLVGPVVPADVAGPCVTLGHFPDPHLPGCLYCGAVLP